MCVASYVVWLNGETKMAATRIEVPDNTKPKV
uniref:Uncharacterized protein n=1 Tax=Anguilla anguilla TaxID=7936 RepID=A0A0E9SDI1_ANGAN